MPFFDRGQPLGQQAARTQSLVTVLPYSRVGGKLKPLERLVLVLRYAEGIENAKAVLYIDAEFPTCAPRRNQLLATAILRHHSGVPDTAHRARRIDRAIVRAILLAAPGAVHQL